MRKVVIAVSLVTTRSMLYQRATEPPREHKDDDTLLALQWYVSTEFLTFERYESVLCSAIRRLICGYTEYRCQDEHKKIVAHGVEHLKVTYMERALKMYRFSSFV